MNKTAKSPVFSIGSDPELLLVDRRLGRPVSAIDVLKRSKYDRIDFGNDASVYYDNVLAEMTVHPGKTRDELVAAFREVFTKTANYIGKDFEIVPRASHTYLDTEVDHDDARAAGCSPEFDAYLMMQMMPPQFEGGFRSAGGHIHLGVDNWKEYVGKDFEGKYVWNNFIKDPEGVCLIDPMSKLRTIKLMDILVGLSVALIDVDPSSAARKKLYGNAGRHRPTPYGVEYRSLGNYWLSSPTMVELVYDLTRNVLALEEAGRADEVIALVDESEVIEGVNTNSATIARRVLEALPSSVLPVELLDRTVKLSVAGAKTSFYEEWGIKL